MTKYANRVGLTIGLPFSGNPIVPEFALALTNLHPPMNYNLRFNVVKGQAVAEARNFLAECAIKDGSKYLFFVDEDVTPPAHAIRQLVFHLEHFPKAMIAGGIYCHKAPPSFPMVFRGNGAGPYWNWKVGEVFDCSGLGMGCALIRTEVFSKIEKPYFKTIDSIESFMDGVPNAEAWTEDLYFCHKVIEAGYDILADGGILPNHWDASGKPHNLPPSSYPLLRTKSKGTKKIVDLGAGTPDESYHTDEGDVLRVDLREDANPDYRCDLRWLPFANDEFDIVYSSHTLEHFKRSDIEVAIKEWVRILKPEGELRLVLPNIQWAAKHVVEDNVTNDVLNVFYGAQSYELNCHYMGFTPKMIELLLGQYGFTKFVWDHIDYHMFVRAWRKPPDEIKSIPHPALHVVIPGGTAETDSKRLRVVLESDLESAVDDLQKGLTTPDENSQGGGDE